MLNTMTDKSAPRREPGWLMRRFSPQEIGLEMDLPVRVLKSLTIVSQIDPLVLTKIVDMPPSKYN